MPKSIVVDPRETRKTSTLTFTDIPLNAYVPDTRKETAKYGKEALVRAYRDMLIIREFEEMIVKLRSGAYEPIREFNYRGPTHVSAGQEGTAAGARRRA